MTNRKHYVSALASRGSLTDIDLPGVVVTLYGYRGGTICTAELNVAQSIVLRDQLNIAVDRLIAEKSGSA